MSKLDWIAAWLLFAIGCVHVFVAAPMSFRALDQRALWFVTGGLSIWFAAALNIVWMADRARRLTRWTALAANLVMMVFVLAYAAVAHQFDKPAGLLLIGLVAFLTARTALVSPAPRSPAM